MTSRRRHRAWWCRSASPRRGKSWLCAEWEEELVGLAASAGDEFLVGGYSTSTRRTGHLAERLVVPTGHPRLAPARLRSTWLLGHLRAGTRLPELCRAAGLEGVTVLSDLLEFVEPLDDAAAAAMLRGTASVSRAPIDTSGGRPTSAAELNIARQLIRRSGLVDVLAPCMDAEVGRPRHLGLEALLVVFQLNALHRHHQAHLVEAARVLNALTDDQRAALCDRRAGTPTRPIRGWSGSS